jgi:hypothetical protein
MVSHCKIRDEHGCTPHLTDKRKSTMLITSGDDEIVEVENAEDKEINLSCDYLL